MFAWFGQWLPVWETVCTHEITHLNLVCLLVWTKICTIRTCIRPHSFWIGLLLCSEYVFCSCLSRIADMLLYIPVYAFIHKYKLGHLNQIWLLVSIRVCVNQKFCDCMPFKQFCWCVFFLCLLCLYAYLTCAMLHVHNYTYPQYQVIWTRSDCCFRPRFA